MAAPLPPPAARGAEPRPDDVPAWTWDDALLRPFGHDPRPRLRIYVPDETLIVIGRGSRPARELYLEACRRDAVSVQRRPGGGCAVLLDPGNLILSLALPAPGLEGITRAYEAITAWLIAGLARIGIEGIERAGTSDLAQGDCKLGGSCIHRRRDLLYYSTTLLVAPRIDLMERWLRHPPREPGYRRGRPHRRFVRPLWESHAWADPVALARDLTDALAVESLDINERSRSRR